ncbi:hypothetical protein BB559_002410 [Furculomyces boomerangus]|uniref:Transcription initiation factor TFIID subunit 11 n=1 Tax=Furculomyces boomerangus TaxID=61424 RepID=A0A2T9YVP3_9FUNG|nr:hypothetical protein BB559_005572 [Furculomyces boomerangus]PVU96356.1 hypothetical protein BB559_002410 [Furculomyces boomerangus]
MNQNESVNKTPKDKTPIAKPQPQTNITPMARGYAGFRNSIKSKLGRGSTRGGRGGAKSVFVKNTKTITLTGLTASTISQRKRIRFVDDNSSERIKIISATPFPEGTGSRSKKPKKSILTQKNDLEQNLLSPTLSLPKSESNIPLDTETDINTNINSLQTFDNYPNNSLLPTKPDISTGNSKDLGIDIQDENLDGDGDGLDSKSYSYSVEDQYDIAKQSKEEIKDILDSFSEVQKRRYEVYRRTALNKPAIKKLVSSVLNQQVSQTLAFVIAGFGKVFVGEIIELSSKVMEEWNDNGPIQPKHIIEAYRRYRNSPR